MRDAEHFNCPGCALQLYIMSKMNCYIAPNHHPCQLTMVVMEGRNLGDEWSYYGLFLFFPALTLYSSQTWRPGFIEIW